MVVQILNHSYKMSPEEYRKMLKLASEQVPFGVYALEKGGMAELRKDDCKSKGKSKGKLKELIRAYRLQGFKVYQNGV